MTTQEVPNKVRGVYVEALALEGIEQSGDVIGNVGEADSIEGSISRESGAAQILTTGTNRRIVNVAGALGLSAAFVVAEEIAVAAADHQFGGRGPVGPERIHRQRVYSAVVGTESARIGRSAGIQLAIGAVRAAE